MASGIAHEINNPLTSVVGFSELVLSKTNLPEDVREELKIINNGKSKESRKSSNVCLTSPGRTSL